MRLGVPAFYASMLSDIDVHCARSTVTAHGTTVAIAEMVHRQLHGTGQGTVKGPINWIPVAGMIIAIVRKRITQPVTMPAGTGRSLMVDRTWFVGDSGLAQAGCGSTAAVQVVVDWTGLMYYFLGLERRANKCLWVKLRWALGKLVWKARGKRGELLGRNWLACWHERGVHIVEQQPLVIQEHDYDEEFRYLCYTASLVDSSKKSMGKLTEIARRATSAFLRKPNLRFGGASIVTSVPQLKFVYQIAFVKASASVVCVTESAYDAMLRHSMSVAQGFPWDVLAGSAEYDGLGANRLTTEVTKTRLRLFQSLTVSRFASENELSLAMVCLAQRWRGASTPTNTLHAKDLRLLLPLGDEASEAAHMFHELRLLGYSLAVGWRCESLADGDATVYDALVGAAGDDDETKLSDDKVTELQRWRRCCNVMWVSEPFRADGRTLRTRFAAGLRQRIRNCEADTQRICNVAFGRGRIAPGPRGRVGLPRAAAWDVIEVGEFV